MSIEYWNACLARMNRGVVIKRHVGASGYYMVAPLAGGGEYLLNSAMSREWVEERCAEMFRDMWWLAFPEERERAEAKRIARQAAERAALDAERAALDAEWQKVRELMAAEKAAAA